MRGDGDEPEPLYPVFIISKFIVYNILLPVTLGGNDVNVSTHSGTTADTHTHLDQIPSQNSESMRLDSTILGNRFLYLYYNSHFP